MVAAKTKTDGHSAKPLDAALRIAVLGSPQFTPTVAGRLRALTPHGEVVALGDFGLITGDAIALGAGAGAIVVVAAQGEGLSLATRQALLLAWGLGARPILVLVETAAPKPAQIRPCRTNNIFNAPCCAPSARRMPISRVRCATV